MNVNFSDKTSYMRKHGEIKFMWPRLNEFGVIVMFLVHWIGFDCIHDATYELPDDANLSDAAYAEMLEDVPNRYIFNTYNELEHLRQRFQGQRVTFWQLLTMAPNLVWGENISFNRRVALERKKEFIFRNHIAFLWHIPERGPNVFLVHFKANQKELVWNSNEFEWLAHGFALFDDQRLFTISQSIPSQRSYPWDDASQALRLIEAEQEKEIMDYSLKLSISDVANIGYVNN